MDAATGSARVGTSPDMRWHARPELQPDFVPAKLRKYLSGRAPRPTGSLKLANRIAFIGDGELCDDLKCFAQIHPLHPDAAEPDADLLLIAGDWPRAGDPWRQALLNVSGQASRLRETIARYKARGIPSALWVTGEAATVEAYHHLKDAVDAMFVPAGVALAGARELDAGVNVKLFNPFSEDPAATRADEPYFRFVVDGAHELSQFLTPEAGMALLGPFLKFNTWLIDTTYHHQVASMKLHPACRRRFLGHSDARMRALLLKLAYGLLLPDVLGAARPAHCRKRAREAAACKTLVFGAAAICGAGFDGPAELGSLLARALEDDVARVAAAHLAWRDVLCRHTMFERLETILAAVNVPVSYDGVAHPRVNVVIPTVRPELIAFALAMFRAQTYANAHLTIVSNGVRVDDETARAIHETANAGLCFVPGDKTIGYCMNYGIDQTDADYWAKWDDDDIYGPHYLEDLLLQRKYVDFDVTGKAAFFNYIEERDRIHIRDFAARDAPSDHVGGGTLLVKREGRYFAEDGRGAEDRAFLFLARERGDRIVAGDPFNFMQIRRKDAASHTWTLGAHALDLRGPTRPGLALESIIL